MKVIGKRSGSFTKDGKTYDYARLYVVDVFSDRDLEENECDGSPCDILKVSPEIAKAVNVGDDVNPVYDKYGKIRGVA